jgi:hypothetical protein
VKKKIKLPEAQKAENWRKKIKEGR